MILRRFYLGTWQLGGDFIRLSRHQQQNILVTALDNGVTKYDTAAVYGNGIVEDLLGKYLPEAAVVLTKVPAAFKPTGRPDESAMHAYPQEWIKQCLENSSKRLRRDCLDIVLLHNWSPEWAESTCLAVLDQFLEFRDRGMIDRVGISLPNGFNQSLSDAVLERVQIVEAPFNPENSWINASLKHYALCGVEVILRSLFMQGMLVKPQGDRALLNPQDYRAGRRYPTQICDRERVLQRAWRLNTSLTVGASTPQQLTANIQTLKEC